MVSVSQFMKSDASKAISGRRTVKALVIYICKPCVCVCVFVSVGKEEKEGKGGRKRGGRGVLHSEDYASSFAVAHDGAVYLDECKPAV